MTGRPRAAGLLSCLLVTAFAFAGCSLWIDEPPPDSFYRDAMRSFVETLSAAAHVERSGFLVVPQNGEALLTIDGSPSGPLAADYLLAIDGLGREDLFYGYTGDDVPTPSVARDEMLPLLRRAEQEGLEILVTDYCTTPAHVATSYDENAARGFVSFAAPSRELGTIPAGPPYAVHSADVAVLTEVRNFLYLINPSAFPERVDLLAALRATDHDLLILDPFAEDGEHLTPSEIASLKLKAGGGRRLVLAYLSIGEAEDYRTYWHPDWTEDPPAWLETANPDWPGNVLVRYWHMPWHEIILAELDAILAAGFDGAYLDKVDAYESFENDQSFTSHSNRISKADRWITQGPSDSLAVRRSH